MARSRSFCFTCNNWTDAHKALIADLDTTYSIYGEEVGESGTPHLQGFLHFKSARTETSIRKKLPGFHIEISRSVEASITYCKKDGRVTELGDPPAQGSRTDISAVCDMVKKKRSLKDIAEEHPETYLKFHKGIHMLKSVLTDPYHHEDIRGLWYVGVPGAGKSRKALEENPGAYRKAQNKWFDGYDGETCIILDDLDKGGACLGHYLKIWGDRYPCSGEIKGGTVQLQHTQLIVTSNYTIKELWPDDEQMQAAIKRRYRQIHIPHPRLSISHPTTPIS